MSKGGWTDWVLVYLLYRFGISYAYANPILSLILNETFQRKTAIMIVLLVHHSLLRKMTLQYYLNLCRTWTWTAHQFVWLYLKWVKTCIYIAYIVHMLKLCRRSFENLAVLWVVMVDQMSLLMRSLIILIFLITQKLALKGLLILFIFLRLFLHLILLKMRFFE